MKHSITINGVCHFLRIQQKICSRKLVRHIKINLTTKFGFTVRHDIMFTQNGNQQVYVNELKLVNYVNFQDMPETNILMCWNQTRVSTLNANLVV